MRIFPAEPSTAAIRSLKKAEPTTREPVSAGADRYRQTVHATTVMQHPYPQVPENLKRSIENSCHKP